MTTIVPPRPEVHRTVSSARQWLGACTRMALLSLCIAQVAVAAPGIALIARDAPATATGRYPVEMRVGGFDGAFREGILFPSTAGTGGRVATWESKAGVLKTDAYPADEFVYVLAGTLETVDRDGTTRRFTAGDTFVIPKGWAGEWRMLSDFRKLFVNF